MKDDVGAGSGEKIQDLVVRTRNYALRIVQLYSSLPKTTEAQVLGKQLLRSGTSVGAQYREAKRAKSDADFINKLEGSLQELEETGYWMELISATGISNGEVIIELQSETNELTAIFTSIVKKVKSKKNLNSSLSPHPSSFRGG
jgi:four helix bundle protein